MAIGALAQVLPWQDKTAEENRGRYMGTYLGFVRDRQDPQKTGRVKVFVPSLFNEDKGSESWLDWCLPKSAGLNVPPVDAPVFVTFENGIITHGIYEHGWLLGSSPATSAALSSGKEQLNPLWFEEVTGSPGGAGPSFSITLPRDVARDSKPRYPENKVYKSPLGHEIELDDTPGQPRFRYHHPAGTTILVDPEGTVEIRSVGAVNYRPGGDFNVLLGQGATFKVAYPGGSGFTCGAQGFHVTGHQASILGRTVLRKPEEIR